MEILIQATDTVGVEVDVVNCVGEVHLCSVVAPRSEREFAGLVVERVVRDINLTHRLEHTARLPVNLSRVLDYCSELVVLLVDVLRSEGKTAT